MSKFVGFCSLLSELPQCFGKLQDTWRSGFLCVARTDPLHPLNPSKYPDLYVDTQQLCSSLSEQMLLELQLTIFYSLPCSSLWVEIATLAYETNKTLCPHTLSVSYCIRILQTKLMLKNQRLKKKKKTMFTASGGPTDVPLVVLG
jgi:hypothetical protein